MGIHTSEVQKLYIAYFNRPADAAGLAYWEAQLAGGASMEQVQNSFSASAEYQAIYTGTANVTLINTLYNNLFGRDAEPAGLLWWAAQMDAGLVTITTIAGALASGTTAGSNDNLAIVNKIAAATAFTEALDTTTEIIGYTTASAYAVASTWLSTVTNDAATLTAATASVDATVTAAVAASTVSAGETFTLTTGADNKTGTSGNDSFDGSLSSTSMTFGPADTISGGAGTDSLTIISNAAGTYSAASISNVENISLTANTGAATLSLAGVTGVETLSSVGSTEDVTFSGLASLSTVVKVVNPGADDSTTVTFAASVVSGTSDTATVSLNGVAHTTTNDTDDINVQDVETLNIVTTGAASTVDAFDTDATKFVITGDQNLTVGEQLVASNAALLTVDASAFTGALTFTADAATAMTVTGGSGNDSMTFTGTNVVNDTIDAGAGNDTVTFSANLATTDTVKGGDGTDTLQLTTALATGYTAPATATITGFETLKLSNALAGGLTTANIQAGITTVDLNAGSGAQTLTLEAGAQNVKIGASNTGAFVIADTGTATTDSVTVTNTGAAVDMFNTTALTITGFETLNLVGTGTGAATSQDLGVLGMTADTGGSTTANFSGSNTFTATTINAKTISASGLSGSAVLTMAGAITGVAQTITGGGGADTLYGASDTAGVIDGGAGNDSIYGGSGNDSLTGNDGNDSITSGAGNDTINGGAGNDTLVLGASFTTGDVLDGGDGTDTLSITTAGASTIAGLSISAITNLNAATSNIERVTVSNAFDVGSAFDMARLDSINYITLAGGYTGAEEISGLANDSTVVLNTAPGDGSILTLTLADSTGSADSLNYAMVQAASDDYDVLAVSGVETLNISATEATANSTVRVATLGLNITTATAGTTVNFTGTETITIDTVIAAQTINSTTTGAFIMTNTTGSGLNQTITTGDGADSIYGGGGVDTISTGAGGDSIVGGSGADVITSGTGADTIVGGSGNDSITLTEASASVDDVVLDYSEAGTYVDRVTGFTTATGGDEFQIDLSALEAASTLGGVNANATNFVSGLDANGDAANTNAGGVEVLTGAETAGAGDNVFIISNATFSATTEVEDALELGGAYQLGISTTDADVIQYDQFLVMYTDGTDAHLAVATVTTDAGTNGYFSVGNLTVKDLAVIVGVSSLGSTTFASDNFEYIS